jgi:hypothetical protein
MEFGKTDGEVRAKRRPYISVVLTRQKPPGFMMDIAHFIKN